MTVEAACTDHMTMLLDRFAEMGLEISSSTESGISKMSVTAPDRLRSIDVATLPYPGIATDYKPLIITMLSVADGVGVFTGRGPGSGNAFEESAAREVEAGRSSVVFSSLRVSNSWASVCVAVSRLKTPLIPQGISESSIGLPGGRDLSLRCQEL